MSAATEQESAPDFYSLPNGWTWQDVADQREKHDIHERFFPIASGGGAMGWGVPLDKAYWERVIKEMERHDGK
jgi:hypothetical protein